MSTLQPLRVPPLALSGSGSRTKVGQDLTTQNKILTMSLAQVHADKKYDPAPGKRPTTAAFVETFSNPITSVPLGLSLATAGILIILMYTQSKMLGMV